MPSNDPCSSNNLIPVFSPTLVTPGMLSDLSPMSAFKSMNCSVVNPNFSYR